MKGTILFYKEERGFGFITPDQEDEGIFPTDYFSESEQVQKPENAFFHIKNTHMQKEDLRKGVRVEFEPQRNEKGQLAAVNVVKAK